MKLKPIYSDIVSQLTDNLRHMYFHAALYIFNKHFSND